MKSVGFDQPLYILQDAGAEPDVWKIEGLDARADCGKVVEAARAVTPREATSESPRVKPSVLKKGSHLCSSE